MARVNLALTANVKYLELLIQYEVKVRGALLRPCVGRTPPIDVLSGGSEANVQVLYSVTFHTVTAHVRKLGLQINKTKKIHTAHRHTHSTAHQHTKSTPTYTQYS